MMILTYCADWDFQKADGLRYRLFENPSQQRAGPRWSGSKQTHTHHHIINRCLLNPLGGKEVNNMAIEQKGQKPKMVVSGQKPAMAGKGQKPVQSGDGQKPAKTSSGQKLDPKK